MTKVVNFFYSLISSGLGSFKSDSYTENVENFDNKEFTKKSELKVLKDLEIEKLAWSSGFYKEEPKKLYAKDLFLGFFSMQNQGKNSLRNWGSHASKFMDSEEPISKQGISSRLNNSCVDMVKSMLKKSLELKYKPLEKKIKKKLKGLNFFNRILLHDSTTASLPSNVAEHFPTTSSHGKISATARIQCIYDLTNMKWLHFKIGAFTDNDQSNALLVEQFSEKGDLILRDLGYFTLKSLENLTENQFVITKWDNRTGCYTCRTHNPTTGKKQLGDKINLLELFAGKTEVDMPIEVGSKQRLNMRLVARKLPEKKAVKKIAEAKKHRHVDTNHSEEYYKLLEWEIYLTNVDYNQVSSKEITQLYALRWYIEILFKSWKSYCNFNTMLGKNKMSYYRVVISIYLLLIQFVYFMLDIFHYVKQKVKKRTHREISILKFMDVVHDLFHEIINIKQLHELDKWIPNFVQYATYEQRNDRINMMEKYFYFDKQSGQ